MDLNWNEKLETKIPAIDEQHQFLLVALSHIDAAKHSEVELLRLFDQLLAFLSIHFRVEEDYMICAEYPGYAEHKLSHDKVTIEYKKILSQNLSKHQIAIDLIDHMGVWFVEHFDAEDNKMAEFLRANLWKIT